MPLDPPGPPAPGEEEPYGLDDLVADERRQMGWVLLFLLMAIIYIVISGKPLGIPGSDATPAAPAAGE